MLYVYLDFLNFTLSPLLLCRCSSHNPTLPYNDSYNSSWNQQLKIKKRLKALLFQFLLCSCLFTLVQLLLLQVLLAHSISPLRNRLYKKETPQRLLSFEFCLLISLLKYWPSVYNQSCYQAFYYNCGDLAHLYTCLVEVTNCGD